MSRTRSYNDKLHCPSCGSHATQSVPTAYSQSVRSGSSGFTSISMRGESLAPPPEKDDTVLPGVAACVTAAITLFALPALFRNSEITALQGLSLFSWPVLLASCVIGWVSGLLLAIPAISYNVKVRPRLQATWEAGMVCNRCSYQWQRAMPKDDDIERLSRGTQ